MEEINNKNNGLNLKWASDITKNIQRIIELSKAAAQAVAGNWLPLIKTLVPFMLFIIFGVFIFTTLFTSWLFEPKSDGKTSFESPKNITVEKFQQGIAEVVVDAYAEAHEEYIKMIDDLYNKAKSAYDSSSITIVNTLEETSIMNTEIYKVYSMFSTYKDREFLIKHMDDPNLHIKDEAKLYNIKDLKRTLRNNYKLLLTHEESKRTRTYQPTIYDPETGRWVVDEDAPPMTHCSFTYKIMPQPIDKVGPAIFGLQDLTDSTDPNIPNEAKIHEIEMALLKTKSISEIFEGTLDEYSGKESEYGLPANKTHLGLLADYPNFIRNYTVQNINFTVNEKMSVPLNNGYTYSLDDKAGFGFRVHPITKEMSFHPGIDIKTSTGTPIYSLANGVVVKTGYNDGYGNFVVVYHGEINDVHYFSTYNHMHESAYVQEGQQVTSLTKLGIVGSTGLSEGPHLHFEIRIGIKNGNSYKFVFKNPLLFLNIK